MRTINRVFIHCSAYPNGTSKFTIRDIDADHAARGFRRKVEDLDWQPTLPYIGYHGVIDVFGQFWAGRGENEVGAHVEGANWDSLGYCLMGTSLFTEAQWTTLRTLVEDVFKRYGLIKILGHRSVNSGKTCPGFNVDDWLASGMNPLPEHMLHAEATSSLESVPLT